MVTSIIESRGSTNSLRKAIQSVLAQEGCGLELFVVKRSSGDSRSDDVVAEFAGDSRLGCGKCVCLDGEDGSALSLANGEFVHFMDEDDWLIDSGFFRNASKILVENPSYFLAAGYECIRTESHGTVSFERRPHNLYGRIIGSRYFSGIGHGINMPRPAVTVFRKEALTYGGGLVSFSGKAPFLKAALWKDGKCFAWHMTGKTGVRRVCHYMLGDCDGWNVEGNSQRIDVFRLKEDMFFRSIGIIGDPVRWWGDEFTQTFRNFDMRPIGDSDKIELAMWGLCHTHGSARIKRFCDANMSKSEYSPVKLFYHNASPNFGDSIAPYLITMMSGRPAKYTDYNTAELMSIGSMFGNGSKFVTGVRTLPAGAKPLVVWGSGFLKPGMFGSTRSFGVSIDVRAVRGELTRDALRVFGAIGLSDEPALGDPELFVSDIVERYGIREKSYDLAIVPHVLDIRYGERLGMELSRRGIECRVVDVSGDPIDVLAQISAARKVVASAMNALIACDALQIPHRHVRFSECLDDPKHIYQQPEFEFKDYYSAFGIDPPGFITDSEIMSDPDGMLASIGSCDMVPADRVAAVKCGLLDTFPCEKANLVEEWN